METRGRERADSQADPDTVARDPRYCFKQRHNCYAKTSRKVGATEASRPQTETV